MKSKQIFFFMRHRALAEVMKDVETAVGAIVVCVFADMPSARLVVVPPSELAAAIVKHQVQTMFVTRGKPPRNEDDYAFRDRQNGADVLVRIGKQDSKTHTISNSTVSADPTGKAVTVFDQLVKAVSARSEKGVVVTLKSGKRKTLPGYWERGLESWSLDDYEKVLPGKAESPTPKKKVTKEDAPKQGTTKKKVTKKKVTKEDAPKQGATKKKVTKKSTKAKPAGTPSKTLIKRGKYMYGDSVDDLRTEMGLHSKRKGHPIDVFWRPICPCRSTEATAEEPLFLLEFDDEEGAAWLVCAHCYQSRPLADSQDFEATSVSGCYCKLDEEFGQVLVGARRFPGSDDLRWLYVGWRAIGCGLVGVFVDWKVDGSTTWAEVREGWEAIREAPTA